MAQTTPLAAGTTAANSSDVVVKTPVTVSLFSGESDQHMDRCKISIYQKDSNGNYTFYTAPLGVKQTRNRVYLSNTQRQWTFNQPGTYRLVRPITTSSVGINADDQT